MTTHIAKVMEKRAKNIPAVAKMFGEIKVLSAWKHAATSNIARNTMPERFIKGTLYLAAKNPVWMQELNLLKKGLLEKVNARLGEEAVREIRFRVGETTREKGKTPKKEKKYKCSKCGISYSNSEQLCSFCLREEKNAETVEISRTIGKSPWIAYSQMKGKVKYITGEDFSRIKRDIKYKMLDLLVVGKRELKKAKWENIFGTYAELVMGKQKKEIGEKDEKGIRQAVQNKINNYTRRRKFK